MHIAICNNIIAHRKQLERLLKRESDSRKKQFQTIYFDSFGNPSSLMHVAMMYDLFIIDMAEGVIASQKVAADLRSKASIGLIAICYEGNEIPPMEDSLLPCVYLKKPIQANALTALVSESNQNQKAACTPIEIRGKKETIYIPESDIMYIDSKKEDVFLHRTDGTIQRFMGNAMEIAYTLNDYHSFYVNQKYQIINVNYIQTIAKRKITLKDGTILPYPFFEKNYIKGQMIVALKENKENL